MDMHRMGSAIIIVDNDLNNIAVVDYKRVGVDAVDDRIRGFGPGTHGGVEGWDFLLNVRDVVEAGTVLAITCEESKVKHDLSTDRVVDWLKVVWEKGEVVDGIKLLDDWGWRERSRGVVNKKACYVCVKVTRYVVERICVQHAKYAVVGGC